MRRDWELISVWVLEGKYRVYVGTEQLNKLQENGQSRFKDGTTFLLADAQSVSNLFDLLSLALLKSALVGD